MTSWDTLFRLLRNRSEFVTALLEESTIEDASRDADAILTSVSGGPCSESLCHAAKEFLETGTLVPHRQWLCLANYLCVDGITEAASKTIRRHGDKTELGALLLETHCFPNALWQQWSAVADETDKRTLGLFWRIPDTRPEDWAAAGRLYCLQWSLETQPCTADVLIHAAKNGHLDVVHFLCERSTPATARVDASAFYNCALGEACANGHLNIARFLCEKSCPATIHVDASDYGNHAIGEASANGHLDVVRFLCERSCPATAKVDASDRYNYAVERAAVNGHLDVVRFLCETSCPATERVDATFFSNRALWEASEKGHLDVVRFLCERSCPATAQVDASDFYNRAVERAFSRGHMDVVSFLCEKSCPATVHVEASSLVRGYLYMWKRCREWLNAFMRDYASIRFG